MILLSGMPTGSGKSDYDYPALTASIPSLENLPFYSPAQRTPLPPDLIEQFDRIHLCFDPVCVHA